MKKENEKKEKENQKIEIFSASGISFTLFSFFITFSSFWEQSFVLLPL
jgi:hypothetical protein